MKRSHYIVLTIALFSMIALGEETAEDSFDTLF